MTAHVQPKLSSTEIGRRALARFYDLALAAAEREEYYIDLPIDEYRKANEALDKALGAELMPVREEGMT